MPLFYALFFFVAGKEAKITGIHKGSIERNSKEFQTKPGWTAGNSVCKVCLFVKPS